MVERKGCSLLGDLRPNGCVRINVSNFVLCRRNKWIQGVKNFGIGRSFIYRPTMSEKRHRRRCPVETRKCHQHTVMYYTTKHAVTKVLLKQETCVLRRVSATLDITLVPIRKAIIYYNILHYCTNLLKCNGKFLHTFISFPIFLNFYFYGLFNVSLNIENL